MNIGQPAANHQQVRVSDEIFIPGRQEIQARLHEGGLSTQNFGDGDQSRLVPVPDDAESFSRLGHRTAGHFDSFPGRNKLLIGPRYLEADLIGHMVLFRYGQRLRGSRLVQSSTSTPLQNIIRQSGTDGII